MDKPAVLGLGMRIGQALEVYRVEASDEDYVRACDEYGYLYGFWYGYGLAGKSPAGLFGIHNKLLALQNAIAGRPS